MAKTVYKHSRLIHSLGFVKSQNWMMAQANRAIANGIKVTRVWTGNGKGRVLAEVIISTP